jgi:hypothetical protein
MQQISSKSPAWTGPPPVGQPEAPPVAFLGSLARPPHGLRWWWWQGLLHPAAAMGSLPATGPPRVGLRAVVTRFVIQDLVETLPLALLDRPPFASAKVPVKPEHYYRVQLALLPPFGLALWLLMGVAAHAVLRATGQRSDLRRLLDVMGLGMLVPMPALWLADAALIAVDRFGMPALGFTHVPVQVWETSLIAVGIETALDVPRPRAWLAAVTASTVYALGASRVLR